MLASPLRRCMSDRCFKNENWLWRPHSSHLQGVNRSCSVPPAFIAESKTILICEARHASSQHPNHAAFFLDCFILVELEGAWSGGLEGSASIFCIWGSFCLFSVLSCSPGIGGWTPAGGSRAPCPYPAGLEQKQAQRRGLFTCSKINPVAIWRFGTSAWRKGTAGAGNEDRVNVIVFREAACPCWGWDARVRTVLAASYAACTNWWGWIFSLVSL